MVDVTGIEPVTPLLAKIGRTKNQQLTRAAMSCLELRHVAALLAHSAESVALHRSR
jgi:hypothetical protein